MNTFIYLQVGDPHSGDHSEHYQEHASDHRLWDGDEHSAELPKEPQDDHEEPSRLQDQPASNLVPLIKTDHQANSSGLMLWHIVLGVAKQHGVAKS